MQGLSLDSSLLPSLATARVPVATLTNPTDYGFDSHNVWDVPGVLLQDAIGSLGGLSAAGDPFLTKASQTAGQADQLRRQLGRSCGEPRACDRAEAGGSRCEAGGAAGWRGEGEEGCAAVAGRGAEGDEAVTTAAVV